MSGDSLNEIVKPGLRQVHEVDKKNWFPTEKFSKRTPGSFKPQFVATRGLWLTAKRYLVQDQHKIEDIDKNKYSCKGVSKKHNDLHFKSYMEVLDVFHKIAVATELEGLDIGKAKNVGFRVYDRGMVTYKPSKLGLSAYCDKH